ncbi:MAG: hypothetical protein KC636_29675 [Myxococcales bacterium]|nr:hypothetical protein [Myxococcales bacterium]
MARATDDLSDSGVFPAFVVERVAMRDGPRPVAWWWVLVEIVVCLVLALLLA